MILHDDEGNRGIRRVASLRAAFLLRRDAGGRPPSAGAGVDPPSVQPSPAHPRRSTLRCTHGVRGNRFARAAVDTARGTWKRPAAETGLRSLLAERLGGCSPANESCGVALGIPADRSTTTLRRWIEQAIPRGYRRVKIKVAPGWDADPIKAAAETGRFRVAPDGGCQRGLRVAGARETPSGRWTRTDLLYIEQPLPPDELVGHARLSQELRTPVCVDETLHDARAARQIIELADPGSGTSRCIGWVALPRSAGSIPSPSPTAPSCGPVPCPNPA